jgi:hypothetical protein
MSPYIDLDKLGKDTAALLVQTSAEEADTAIVQTVRDNYEGYTMMKVLEAKEARQVLGMIGNPSKRDRGMVGNNIISYSPVTTDAITNACTIFGPDLAST